MFLGESFLLSQLANLVIGTVPDGYDTALHPMAYAGWAGLFVTALNLLPIGQLDGGHISYALLGKKAKFIGILAFVALALLNFYATNWLLWTLLILFLIRLKHPPTLNDRIDLDRKRKILAWISYLIFISCFSPKPLYFG